jgi:hypothetical protein
MPWTLYLRGKSPQYPLERRLDGPQSQSGCCGEEKNLLPLINFPQYKYISISETRIEEII